MTLRLPLAVYANRQIHPIMLIVIMLSVITLSVVAPFLPGQNVHSLSSYILSRYENSLVIFFF